MREVGRVAVAVLATDLFLRLVGIWSWIASSTLGRWPWLIDRYAFIFPAALLVSVLGLRRWRPARYYFLAAGLSGAVAGLISSVLVLALAQLVTTPERARFVSGLQLEDGVSGFLLFGSGIALFRTLGWLYGSIASLLALIADRAEQHYSSSREPSRSRPWPWTLLLVVSAAVWTGNLSLFNWWAAGGPPTPHPEFYQQRCNLFFALTAALVLTAAVLIVMHVRRRRASESEDAEAQ